MMGHSFGTFKYSEKVLKIQRVQSIIGLSENICHPFIFTVPIDNEMTGDVILLPIRNVQI